MPYRFMRYPNGKTKAVTLSYDDGVKQDIKLAEICNKYAMKCTFNICKPHDDSSGRLTADEIREHISAFGHEVAVHGYEHKAPSICSDIEIYKDVYECRRALENEFDIIIKGMAYPDCGIRRADAKRYEEIKTILKSLGIVYARTLGEDNNRFELPTDFYAWMPSIHHNNPYALEYAKEFTRLNVNESYFADRQPRLFYIWGHSYEFDSNNNWNRIEELCEILSRREDTWYATNIEIFNYVNAYNLLVFNAENTRVYNPTLIDVWLDSGKGACCVKSGETVDI